MGGSLDALGNAVGFAGVVQPLDTHLGVPQQDAAGGVRGMWMLDIQRTAGSGTWSGSSPGSPAASLSEVARS